MTENTLSQTSYGFPRDAWQYLSPRLTAKRRQKMEYVARHRTKHIRLVLQDIHDPHNLSACLRSAEAFGVLDVDIVNLYQKFTKPSTVSRGSYNWLKMHRYTDIGNIVADLRREGYKIAAGFPPPHHHYTLEDVPVQEPVAVLFGNEHRGVSPEWGEHIDYRFTIPMVGMVESLNISVSAALSLFQLTQTSQKLLGDSYYLAPQQRTDLLSDWVCQHSRSYQKELERLRSKN